MYVYNQITPDHAEGQHVGTWFYSKDTWEMMPKMFLLWGENLLKYKILKKFSFLIFSRGEILAREQAQKRNGDQEAERKRNSIKGEEKREKRVDKK